MKKPLNKVALALWALAALVIVGEACSLAVLDRGMHMSEAAGGSVYLVIGSIWNMVRSTVMSAAVLAAFGMIVELLDQIRWNTVHQD
jgi:hypothetical protein